MYKSWWDYGYTPVTSFQIRNRILPLSLIFHFCSLPASISLRESIIFLFFNINWICLHYISNLGSIKIYPLSMTSCWDRSLIMLSGVITKFYLSWLHFFLNILIWNYSHELPCPAWFLYLNIALWNSTVLLSE